MPTGDVMITRKHLIACFAFLFGAGTKGDWAASCVEAGYTGRGPSRDSEAVLEAMEAAKELQRRASEMPEDEDLRAIQDAMMAGSSDWSVLLPHARRVMAKIAAGKVAGTNAQMAAIKEIILRAEGKAGGGAPDPADQGIALLILPSVVQAGIPVIDLSNVVEVEED